MLSISYLKGKIKKEWKEEKTGQKDWDAKGRKDANNYTLYIWEEQKGEKKISICRTYNYWGTLSPTVPL